MTVSRRWSSARVLVRRALRIAVVSTLAVSQSLALISPLSAQDASKVAKGDATKPAAEATQEKPSLTPEMIAAAYPKLRDLDGHCPFTPPASMAAWEPRAAELKEQLLVTLGLWPMPKLEPVKPKIYGKIPLDGYTIEKVTFESLPGFYVTGNLYRPETLPAGRKVPAVLCPHGHWENARFYDLKPQEIRNLLATGAERFESAARNHLQAKCVQLARMGCVVFHWDMIGYCDSTQISFDRAHRFGKQDKESEVTDAGWLLYSPLAESHNQSIMGLQTLAGIRAVDFVLGLPEVDKDRIGITGASGGGTQSFLTAAVEPRIGVAFPAVMVSTGMQGGCTCENSSGTRTGTGNVELAALIAPRPLGLTAADDWTRNMAKDGFPELQSLYNLFGAKNKVALFPAVHFGHNYNHVARVSMYGWMNKHFGLGMVEPVLERDFIWQGHDTLHVWDAEHPEPEGGIEFERKLMKAFRDNIDGQLQALLSEGKVGDYLKTVGTGWKVSLGLTTGPITESKAEAQGENKWQLTSSSDGTWKATVSDSAASDVSIIVSGKSGENRRRVAVALLCQDWNDKGELVAIDKQPLVGNPRLAAAYTYGYNEPLIARRARQLAATAAWLHAQNPDDVITLEGKGAGAALAAAAAFDLSKTAPAWAKSVTVQLQPDGFRFAKIDSIRDVNFLPGSARFGDLVGLVSCLPQSVVVTGSDSAEFAKVSKVIESQGGRLSAGPQ